jgi:hypothetical protein
MHTLRVILAGTGIISALLLLPAIVLFATAAYPPVRTRSACRPAGALATRSVLGVTRPSSAGQSTSAGPSTDTASVAQMVRSSARTQLRLLKMVELGLCAAHVTTRARAGQPAQAGRPTDRLDAGELDGWRSVRPRGQPDPGADARPAGHGGRTVGQAFKGITRGPMSS